MGPGDIEFLAVLVRVRSGIELRPENFQPIISRLDPVARRFGFRDVKSLLAGLRNASDTLVSAVVESILIRDTAFFRDPAIYAHFIDEVLPQLCELRVQERQLRIWCAGVSAGQECYSLAMLIDEVGLSAPWRVELTGTDISADAIARAKEGRYSSDEVRQGVSAKRLLAHFAPENGRWRICARLRRMARFHAVNLVEDFRGLGSFDAIFCRNVLIHFDPATRVRILRKLENALAPGGCLVLGSKETAFGLSRGLCPLGFGPIYTKGGPRARVLALAS